MLSLQGIYNLFATITSSVAILIIFAQIVNRLFFKKTPVKLDKNSFVVITGACTGIGKVMVLQLAKLYHCRILIIDVRSDLFEEISSEIGELGGSCECKKADLADKNSVEEIINTLLQRNQKIDLFIYNAGILSSKRTWDLTEREHEMVMRVNYFTPTIMIKRLQPLLRHISVTGSIVSIMTGGTNISIYTSSKHALVAYLASLRQEYKKDKKNITVSVGCPYAVNTTMVEGYKTKLDFVFPILDQNYVGKRLLKEYIEKKELCYIYEYEAVVFRIMSLLPTSFLDFLSIEMDISNMHSAKMLQEASEKND